MMEDPSTDTLRQLAPCWTLAGDERLLTILQNTHQKLVAKCQEANCQLEQMASALDDASITLQNVNNQFMALSSSQFIESRVYDDDADVATDTPATKEPPKPSPADELSIIKRSIAVIESTHEVITILHDSDTESDSDDELPDRLVMKPKDLYADRPLPYIIGSEPWKNKWHAGLMPEDTDTDSSTSKVDRESDQYSLSEPEDFEQVQHPKVQDNIPVPQHARKISETSSELPSEATPTTKPTPADVASEIARRLGGGLPTPKLEPEHEYDEPTKPTVSKIYKPQQPIASTIFPDEPPPLEDQSEEEADIFADLHRNQPYKQPYARQYVTDELFGDDMENDEGGDIFSDFANQPSNITKPTSLFDAGPKPHMFDRQPIYTEPVSVFRPPEPPVRTEQPRTPVEHPVRTVEPNHTADANDDRGVKKPIGGISLFGSNKGAESIGAAILKRNRRKSSTSGDESGNDAPDSPPSVNELQAKKEKDIFDDLFAKSEAKKVKPKGDNIIKDIKHEIQRKKEEKTKKEAPKVVDLFSDNLFDDIDDIFTTNIVKSSKDNKKSIFEDDDDLFSEIAEPKTVKQDIKSSSDNKKGLFDSDDDLFSEKIANDKPSISNKIEPITKVNENATKPTATTQVTEQITSIFDDDEGNIFSNLNTSKLNDVTKVQNVTINKGESNLTENIETSKKVFNSPSLFDDDDECDLFAERVKSSSIVQKKEAVDTVETSNKTEVKISVDIHEKNIDVIITSPEKLADVTSSITEANSSQAKIEIKTDTLPSSSVKTDNNRDDIIINQHDPVKEETKIFANTSNDKITNTEKGSESNNYDTSPETVKENVPTSNLDISNKPTAIQKMLDDNNDKTSEDDFSEQDFDDEPIQEIKPNQNNTSNAIPNVKTSETHTIHNIFDNSALEEDIFASPNNIAHLDKNEYTNTEKVENSETKIDNNTDIISTSDIFTDIVTEPPAFEKPKEPKKSKNVNALFDDDSDDEALFFKKEDVIIDEKPEDFTIKQDRLFDLFTDEPPEEDFTKVDDDLNDDLFSSLPKPNIPKDKAHHTSNFNNDFAMPDDLNVSSDVPIIDDVLKPADIVVPDNIAIPEVNKEVKNVTTIYKPEKQSSREESKIPDTETKENTDDIFKLTTTEIKQPQPVKESSSIFDDNNDIFKEPVSLTSNLSEKQEYILDDDEELFQSLPVHLPQQKRDKINKNQDIDNKSDEELFKSLPIIEKSYSVKEMPKPSLSNKDIFKLPLQRSNSTNSDLQQEKSEIKKVGKLKVGLNINVNALLPGASPKKVKPIDSPDGQTQSIADTPNDDPKMTKSVSFDGKPGSEVLDNKLSKERPRIQVKRRPSTRKARREAVRKSGIDFGDDSTDNSSSIDDPPKPQPEIKNIEDTSNNVDDKDTTHKDIEYIEPPKVEANVTPTKSEAQDEKLDIQDKIEPLKQPVKSDSTTKIVYILNDEDIFNTSVIESPESTNDLATPNLATNPATSVTRQSDILDPSADLNLGIKTLGNTYKSTKGDDSKNVAKSLFGDDEHSDNSDELFKNKKPVAKSKIFDSDSEEELFGSSKKVEKVMKRENVMNVEKVKEVKGSLFGDDDDDDDLFAVKTKKIADPPPQPQRSTPSVKEQAKPTQAVFEDPLSMFGDDD